MVVDHGCQQVVGSADGVEITGKMQVDVLHGDYLGIAAAGSAALYAKDRSEGGLSESHHHMFPDPLNGVCQADRCSGLALACGRGVDGGDENQLADVYKRQH